MAKKESRLNLQMAMDQKRLALMTKRDSEALKGIFLVGVFFWPGAFIAVS